LVVNDDGMDGPGLVPLLKALSRLGPVTGLVPERERSTASHSLTLHKPLRVHEVRRPGLPSAVKLFSLSGTPADCARFGILKLSARKPALVVSGINHGYNLGFDTLYSGTILMPKLVTTQRHL